LSEQESALPHGKALFLSKISDFSIENQLTKCKKSNFSIKKQPAKCKNPHFFLTRIAH
jgi:hypothetical protein